VDGRQAAGSAELHHALAQLIPHEDVQRENVKLPKRSHKDEYDDRASMMNRRFVPEEY
jgi:hypothetical protein